MSDLQKHWARVKLAALAPPLEEDPGPLPSTCPPSTAMFDPVITEYTPTTNTPTTISETDDDSSSASSASSTGTIIPSPGQGLFARTMPPPHGGPRSLEPITWSTYFERVLDIEVPDAIIHAYLNSPAERAPLFVMHHGGGSCGLSFAVMATELRRRVPGAGILCPDMRKHGETKCRLATQDLSLPRLAQDFLDVIAGVQRAMKWPMLPPTIFVGHSVGGAVVTYAAHGPSLNLRNTLPPATLLGLAVLDVVEGSAMDALSSMTTYINSRPVGFATISQSIDWHVRSRTLRCLESARTSVPGLLVRDEAVDAQRPWRWRTDLAATKGEWEGWFRGLSGRFLGARAGKLLILAGTDRLDTELMIGQMQGKYQLQVIPEAGHFIHEDVPDKVAIILADFYKRNDRSQLVLPPKVGDLLKQGKKV